MISGTLIVLTLTTKANGPASRITHEHNLFVKDTCVEASPGWFSRSQLWCHHTVDGSSEQTRGPLCSTMEAGSA